MPIVVPFPIGADSISGIRYEVTPLHAVEQGYFPFLWCRNNLGLGFGNRF